MEKTDVLIIGGSASGIVTAVTGKSNYPDKTFMVVRKEKQVLVPCGIPYIFGTVGSPSNKLVTDAVLEKNNIELQVDEAVRIDKNNKIIETKKGDEVQYDKLVIATGSLPIVPPIDGFDKENVFTVKKYVNYLQKLLNKVNESSDMVVVGGCFIGM